MMDTLFPHSCNQKMYGDVFSLHWNTLSLLCELKMFILMKGYKIQNHTYVSNLIRATNNGRWPVITSHFSVWPAIWYKLQKVQHGKMTIHSLNHLKIDVSIDESAIKNNDMSFNQTFEISFPLREVSKYGVFLVRIFLDPDWIQENTDQKNLRIWTLFTQCSD